MSENTRKFVAASLRVLPHALRRDVRGRVSGRWMNSRRVRSYQRDGPFVARGRGAARSCLLFQLSLLSPDWPVGKLRTTSSACFFLLPSRPSIHLRAKVRPVTTEGAWLTVYRRVCLTLHASRIRNYFVQGSRVVCTASKGTGLDV